MAYKCDNCENELQWAPSPEFFTHYCHDCKKCSKCGNYVTPQDLKYTLKYDLPTAHLSCMSEELRDAIENKKVEVAQKEIDFLNSIRMMIMPQTELNPETNQKVAEYAAIKFVVDMDMEEKYLFLKRLESITATVSILLKKDRKSIELKISEKERAKYAAAVSKKDKKPQEKSPAESREPKKKLTPQDKAIAALMKIGISLEDAKVSLGLQN